jgi:hypothetical protein
MVNARHRDLLQTISISLTRFAWTSTPLDGSGLQREQQFLSAFQIFSECGG